MLEVTLGDNRPGHIEGFQHGSAGWSFNVTMTRGGRGEVNLTGELKLHFHDRLID